jgi:hypothetical protein
MGRGRLDGLKNCNDNNDIDDHDHDDDDDVDDDISNDKNCFKHLQPLLLYSL